MNDPSETAPVTAEALLRVAHELRGPAGVIQGSLSELSLALGADASRYRRFFDMAERGVARIVAAAERLEEMAGQGDDGLSQGAPEDERS